MVRPRPPGAGTRGPSGTGCLSGVPLRGDVTRPIIVGAFAAVVVVAAIVLAFFVDREPDDPVRKPSSRLERDAPPSAMPVRFPGRAVALARQGGSRGWRPPSRG